MVSGVSGVIAKLTITVSNIVHTYPDDLNMLVVGPTGTNIVLMANAGGNQAIDGVTLTFDDSATAQLPDSTQIRSGVYRPTQMPGGTWGPPAPTPMAGSSLNRFNGTDPNGTWLLYAFDD